MKRFHILFSALVMLLSPVFIVSSFVSAEGANLVANSSLEDLSASDATQPAGWLKGKWGTHTSVHTIVKTDGHTGVNSAKVDVTSYTSGDSKWYFAPVTVTPGASYQFSEYYKSSVSTDVIVQVENTTGSYSYYYMGSPAASLSSWNLFNADFTAPSNAKLVTVFHVISSVGWLQIDDVVFTSADIVVPIAPTINITSPVSGAMVGGPSVAISASATSIGASVAGVQFKLDGNNLGNEDTSAPYELLWDTTTSLNGNHSLSAVARSTNGLSTISSEIVVSVNNAIPPVDNENLIFNSSVETVNPNNNQLPTNWNNNTWGSNTARFSYDNSGHNGGRSITTQITKYTSGDAKWYANPVDVIPSKNYIYRDYYKANTTSRVVLALIDVSGNYSYQEIASSIPIATDWTIYEVAFTIPANTAKIIVFHLISSAGFLSIDDVLLKVDVSVPNGDTVPNGSVELGSSVPNGWQANAWGANMANFQWVNNGHTGSKSVKTTVSSYVSGDAKWFFNPVSTLTSGNQYRFTTWYKTNVTPKAVVMFMSADGAENYVGMTNPQPSGSVTEWQKYSEVFLVPEGAVAVTAFLFVNENGWLQTDDYSISDYSPTGFSRPLLSLTFDDGYEDNVDTALPLLNQYGFKTTQCYATTFIENNPMQGTEGVLAFYNSGHEICSHTATHPFLTTLNDTDLQYELQHSKEYLESIIGVPVIDFASSYGDYNQHVNNIIEQYYQSHRTVDEGFNSIDNFDKYRLRVQNVLANTTASQINLWIEQAKTDNTWLILVYHRVANNPGPYDTSIVNFEQQLEVIKNSGIVVKTLNDALVEIEAQL